MAVVSILKIREEDLKHYDIVFEPESNKRFFRENLYNRTGWERDKLMGYNTKTSASAGTCSQNAIRKGRYPAPRVRLMLVNSKGTEIPINPKSTREDFKHFVERRYGNHKIVVDKNTENLVWDAICDGL